ncbi:IS4 family transposase [Acidocella aminolytica]|uniref:IS4 family transposase n=1 Tax=Acidocella aminolytica TaxID=33998 RepID=UPI0018F20EF6|nr:IS4 family transposase [Acidocella aminolytica]
MSTKPAAAHLRQSFALMGSPERCVHVSDRESDIYELFCLAQDLGTRFLVRVQTNRLAKPPMEAALTDVPHRVFAQLAAIPWAGRHQVTIGDQNENTALLRIKFASVKTLPPVGKQKRYDQQTFVYIHALEVDPPSDREPINWRLVTNLPVSDLAAAIGKLDWYALRWKIEIFHKIMKSGCRAEDARLQTAERLVKLLALIAVVSWRIFWITMSARARPDTRPETRDRSYPRRN